MSQPDTGVFGMPYLGFADSMGGSALA